MLAWLTVLLGAAPEAGASLAFREARFSHSPQAQRIFKRLQGLEDLLSEQAERLTLQQVIERGLRANPQLAAAYAQVQGEQWSLVAAKRRWSPSLDASSPWPGLLGQSNDTVVTSRRLPSSLTNQAVATRTLAAPTLNLTWTFLNLSRDAQIHAAANGLQAQQWLFDVSARNLLLELQRDYTALQERLDLIDEYRALFLLSSNQVDDAVAKLARRQLDQGSVEQLRAFQRNQLTRLINQTRDLLLASARLAEKLALPGPSLVLPEESLKPLGSWPLDLGTTLEQAVKLREEIKALAAEARRSHWSSQELLRTYWPRLSLQVEGNYTNTSMTAGSPGSPNPNQSESNAWSSSVGLDLHWQLFDGGIQGAEASNRSADQARLLQEANLETLAVQRQVKEAFFNYTTSKLGIDNTKEALNEASQSVRTVVVKFGQNQATITTMIQVFNQYLDAMRAHSATIQLYNDSVFELYRASAQWPEGTLPLLQERVNGLKKQ